MMTRILKVQVWRKMRLSWLRLEPFFNLPAFELVIDVDLKRVGSYENVFVFMLHVNRTILFYLFAIFFDSCIHEK